MMFRNVALLIVASAVVGGCSLRSGTMDPDSSKVINTVAGEQLTESMFLGKWDLDGERTNTANGSGGVTAIPSDVLKDVLGKGWVFEKNGSLRTDAIVGSKPGSWSIEGTDTVVIKESGQNEAKQYKARFTDGFLYLQKADGKYFVFERDKFFGF